MSPMLTAEGGGCSQSTKGIKSREPLKGTAQGHALRLQMNNWIWLWQRVYIH